MVTPVIINPDPEPDIEGDIRSYSHLNQPQTQSPPPQQQQQQHATPIAPQHVFNEKDYATTHNNEGQHNHNLVVVPVESTISSSTGHATSILNPKLVTSSEGARAKEAEAGVDVDRSPSHPENGSEHHQNAHALSTNHNHNDGNGNEEDDDLEEEDELNRHITWGACFKNTIKGCPILCLAPILLPIAWALHGTNQNPVAVFVTCLLGVVPLAAGLGFATEELALRLGEAWGGLLNATFGNAVELLIAILALVKGELDIVQASMIGSILSNILLVLGMSYFAGGLRFHEQLYALVGAQMHISLLGLSITAIVLPAAFHYAYPTTSDIVAQVRDSNAAPSGEELDRLLAMSRGLSFLLLAAYGMFLTFQLYTHAYLFTVPREPQVHPLPGPSPHHGSVFPRPNWVPSADSSSSSSSNGSGSSRGRSEGGGRLRRLRRWSVRSRDSNSGTDNRSDEPPASAAAATVGTAPSPLSSPTLYHTSVPPIPEAPAQPYVLDLERQAKLPPHVRFVGPSNNLGGGALADPSIPGTPNQNLPLGSRPRKREVPKVKASFAFGMLLAMTGLAGITAEFLIGSIDGLTENTNVSREFVGLILLPVIGNSVEHITAVTVSVKDKLNLSMSIAVGSSIQVSLCLLPILVLLGWAIGQPMMLFFDTYETICLVLAVLIVNFAISDGRTNYLEGWCMMMAYLAIALVTWYYDPTH